MTPQHARNISPRQAQDWLATGEAILIDVREPDEFRAEHIAYAASLPLSRMCDFSNLLQLAPPRKIIFQCMRGKRGERACALVPQDNPTCAACNIEGGIEAWKAAGLPVVTDAKAPALTIFRQVQIIVGTLVVIATLAGFGGFTGGFAVAGILGAALALAGLTGWCGLAMTLSKAPWNK